MYNDSLDGDEYEVIGEAHWQLVDVGADDLVLRLRGFRRCWPRRLLYHTLAVLLAGLPYLAVSYYPVLVTRKHQKTSLKNADYICVTDNKGSFELAAVQQAELTLQQRGGRVRYFLYQRNRFVWLKERGAFANVQALNEKLTVAMLLDNTAGITKRQQSELIKLFGTNSVSVPVKSYWSLFVEGVFNPFYLFQLFSMVLWSVDEYYQYAACVFILTAASCVFSLYQTKKMSINLHAMAGSTEALRVSVVRGAAGRRELCVVAAARLVPGDVLALPPGGCVMPCDALLLTGSCIVNESMLTGESVPVTKSPPERSGEVYSTETHKRHTLFAGTQVIQTRFYGNNQVLAKVVRTGFYTSKGELIKSLLYASPMQGFQFYKDAVKFVLVLFCISAVGMAYSIWLYVKRGSGLTKILLRTLDIITIVVPPALPAAMTAGTAASAARLRRRRVYCLQPQRINVAGKMDVICFDKTGTLTEDGLDLYAVLPAGGAGAGAGAGVFGARVTDAGALSPRGELLQALAVCHSLTSIDARLTGDPLDLKMFEFTKWVLEEPGAESTRFDSLAPAVVRPPGCDDSALGAGPPADADLDLPYEIGVLRRFEFSSSAQSMGVVARVLGQPHMLYFVKGAPEKVAGMCVPESIPANFTAVLNEYTSNGFRVIGLASRRLDRRMKWVDAQRARRDALETQMTFLGLLVMQNSLKPETVEVLRDLHEARLRQVMVTGDNIMTAMSVARVCGMVLPHQKLVLVSLANRAPTGDERPPLQIEVVGSGTVCKLPADGDGWTLALEGCTWQVLRHHYPELMDTVLDRGTVFGRFGPDQKTQLVTSLAARGLVVGMCGDGANDCGALKAAHVGVSLSEADASVAAPFTSGEQNIRCVRLLALEGRCALATSFAIFKYMAMYSLIQFFSILILYNFYSILGNYQFLYIDLGLTSLLAIGLGRAGPAEKLCARPPPAELASWRTVLPLLLHVALVVAGQLGAVALLRAQPWSTPLEGGPEVEEVECWENTSVFLTSCFQYLALAFVYARGAPHRQPAATNYFMVGTLLCHTSFVLLLMWCPWPALTEVMQVVGVTEPQPARAAFRAMLLALAAAHVLLAKAVEALFEDVSKFRRLTALVRRRGGKQAAPAPPPGLALWPQLC